MINYIEEKINRNVAVKLTSVKDVRTFWWYGIVRRQLGVTDFVKRQIDPLEQENNQILSLYRFYLIFFPLCIFSNELFSQPSAVNNLMYHQ